MCLIFQTLEKFLPQHKNHNFVIALSGGLDSSVLLHAMTSLTQLHNFSVRALHINHNLQAAADLMEESAREEAKKLGVDFCSIKIKEAVKNNIEEQARFFRYKNLLHNLTPQEILLTAHHSDDRLETFFLKLLKGCNIFGLTSLQETRFWGDKLICRPLLNLSKQNLRNYADTNKLKFYEDPSNYDTRFKRNYLRKNLNPVLQNFYPEDASQTTAFIKIHKSLDYLQDLSSILESLIAKELEVCSPNKNSLSLKEFNILDEKLATLVMLGWCHKNQIAVNQSQLKNIVASVKNLDSNSKPLQFTLKRSPNFYTQNQKIIMLKSYKQHLFSLDYKLLKNMHYLLNLTQNLPRSLDRLNKVLVAKFNIKIKTSLLSQENKARIFLLPQHLIKTLIVNKKVQGLEFNPALASQLKQQLKELNLNKKLQNLAIPPWLRDSFPCLLIIYQDNFLQDNLLLRTFIKPQEVIKANCIELQTGLQKSKD